MIQAQVNKAYGGIGAARPTDGRTDGHHGVEKRAHAAVPAEKERDPLSLLYWRCVSVCVCVASAKASALNGNEGAFHLSCTTLLLKDNETRTMLRGNRIKLMRNAHKFPLQKRFANAICECDALTSLSFWPADELCLCLSVLAEITAGSRSPSPAAADPSVHHRTDATAAATDACSPAGPTDRPNDHRRQSACGCRGRSDTTVVPRSGNTTYTH
jgi:hypothetical protein